MKEILIKQIATTITYFLFHIIKKLYILTKT